MRNSLVLAGLIGLLTTAPAFAVFTLDDEAVRSCPQKQVWHPDERGCVEATAGAVSDEALAEYAYFIARKEERYAEALALIDLAKDQGAAKILGYRGFFVRKLGRPQEALEYYHASLAIEPNNPLTREYLGEAYVMLGDLDRAKAELAAIERICGRKCEPYEDLEAALQAAGAAF